MLYAQLHLWRSPSHHLFFSSFFFVEFGILFRRIRYVAVDFSKGKALSLLDCSLSYSTRRPRRSSNLFIVVYVVLLKERALGIFTIRSIVCSFISKRVRTRSFFDFSLPALVFSHFVGWKKINRQWSNQTRENIWKRENIEKRRLYGTQNKSYIYERPVLASLLSAFPFERERAQDDSTNNIIPGHCGIFLLFPSLFFFTLVSIRYTSGQRVSLFPPVRGYFYPRSPSSLPAPPLPLQVFSCCADGGIMKQAYSLYFLQRAPSVSRH